MVFILSRVKTHLAGAVKYLKLLPNFNLKGFTKTLVGLLRLDRTY